MSMRWWATHTLPWGDSACQEFWITPLGVFSAPAALSSHDLSGGKSPLRLAGFDFSKRSKRTVSVKADEYISINLFPFFKKGNTRQHSCSEHGPRETWILTDTCWCLILNTRQPKIWASLSLRIRITVYLTGVVSKCNWMFISSVFIIMTKKEDHFCLWNVNWFWKYFPRSL